MSDEQLIMSLAKVLIAAAWADGDLAHEEVNRMKDLLYALPQLTAEQWARLAIYMDSPVRDAERERLVEELRSQIRTPKDRDLALEALRDLMMADGQVTEEEREAANDIEAAIESADLGALSKLVRGMGARRSLAMANAPNREDYLEDYLRNRVYYGIRRRVDEGETELDVGEDTLRTLSLAGGVMAQVARTNPQVTKTELGVIADALQTYWHLTPQQAAFVAEVAVDETASHLDRYRLAREFADVCTYKERASFLDVLFAVAAADGMATYEEIEEIRSIANTLKLSHETFINAKLRLPREQRAQ